MPADPLPDVVIVPVAVLVSVTEVSVPASIPKVSTVVVFIAIELVQLSPLAPAVMVLSGDVTVQAAHKEGADPPKIIGTAYLTIRLIIFCLRGKLRK